MDTCLPLSSNYPKIAIKKPFGLKLHHFTFKLNRISKEDSGSPDPEGKIPIHGVLHGSLPEIFHSICPKQTELSP